MFADYHATKEYWVEVVRSAEDRGKEVPTRPAITSRDKRDAVEQRIAISRKSFGIPAGYERIKNGR